MLGARGRRRRCPSGRRLVFSVVCPLTRRSSGFLLTVLSGATMGVRPHRRSCPGGSRIALPPFCLLTRRSGVGVIGISVSPSRLPLARRGVDGRHGVGRARSRRRGGRARVRLGRGRRNSNRGDLRRRTVRGRRRPASLRRETATVGRRRDGAPAGRGDFRRRRERRDDAPRLARERRYHALRSERLRSRRQQKRGHADGSARGREGGDKRTESLHRPLHSLFGTSPLAFSTPRFSSAQSDGPLNAIRAAAGVRQVGVGSERVKLRRALRWHGEQRRRTSRARASRRSSP